MTVTDERMSRYFMTIPEAVQLIIRAGSLGGALGSESVDRAIDSESLDPPGAATFVLEMGDPVKIVDLAEAMIRLSGLEPERDIAIQFLGARPGEKFHEDLFNPYERPQPTPAQRIVRADHDPLDPDWVERTFAEINLLVLEGDAAALTNRVSRLARARMTEGLDVTDEVAAGSSRDAS